MIKARASTGPLNCWFSLERVTRIELALSAWEADVLPLNYTRTGGFRSLTIVSTGWTATARISYRTRKPASVALPVSGTQRTARMRLLPCEVKTYLNFAEIRHA